MATIYDVAALAGVSPATVSRVFNGITVSAERSERVRAAAERLSFIPNRTARTLRKQSSEVIALIIPDIENPFFTALARGVEDVAQASGYSVVLCNTDEDAEKEARYLDVVVSENMAGIILAAASDLVNLTDLTRRGRPVVAVDRSLPEVDTVTVDNVAGGRDATRALVEQGFQRIACITGPTGRTTAEGRADGWREVLMTMSAAHVDPDRYLRYADFRVEGGHAAMVDLLNLPEPPDAVFVANNLMAVGALRALIEHDLTPPLVGMASFGDLPFATLSPRGVTVIPLPARLLGEAAAQLLIERLQGDDRPRQAIRLGNPA
ncbi:LacI family DNA-binding transcriptional regulator [Cryobacterium gelidum]|uniref:LacI family transcriptional regulator n=1 Tax=Cryobacterium gelidum TaxID=1259164 RepID=A0A4R9AXE2_9MICO|nr:LacI family DNA-binding transcriptional regulator [Cryobacterium gelidum]TFD70839.1 LacI family transcriptional regulator [Cryobacterium gelidum]